MVLVRWKSSLIHCTLGHRHQRCIMETERSQVRPTCSVFELLVLRSHGRNLSLTSGSCEVFLSLYVSKWVLITSSLHSTALKRHLKVSLWSKNLRFFNRFALFIQISCNKNQCGGFVMFIPDPGSWVLPIPDPGSKNSNKREGWKKLVVKTFYVATNFTKLQIILVSKCWRKKCGPIFKE